MYARTFVFTAVRTIVCTNQKKSIFRFPPIILFAGFHRLTDALRHRGFREPVDNGFRNRSTRILEQITVELTFVTARFTLSDNRDTFKRIHSHRSFLFFSSHSPGLFRVQAGRVGRMPVSTIFGKACWRCCHLHLYM